MLSIVLGLLLAAPSLPADGLAQSAPEPILVSQAEAPERSADTPKAVEPQPPPQPRIYQAPRTGQPRGRMAAITRGPGESGPGPAIRPLALAPEHVAETVRSRPHLYWSIDRAHDGPIVFTLSSRAASEPACELDLPGVSRPGAQAIDLGACPDDLEIGVEYEWFVAVVTDPQRRSRDAISQGWIRRVAPPGDLDLERATPQDLASRGLWYDALHAAAAGRDRGAWQALIGELSLANLELPASAPPVDRAGGRSVPAPGAR